MRRTIEFPPDEPPPPGPWVQAAMWLGYSAGGLLFPVVIGVVVMGSLRLDMTIETFTGAGQFAIYSVAMWVTIYYLITKRSRHVLLPQSDLLGLMCFFGAGLAVVLFVLATISTSGTDLNNQFFQWPSVSLFAVSGVLGFVTVGLDNRFTVDLVGGREHHVKELGEKFEGADGEEGSSDD